MLAIIADAGRVIAKTSYICAMKYPTIEIDSITAYNEIYGLPTRHPLVSVVNLKNVSHVLNHVSLSYGIYAVFLKRGAGCALRYGNRHYDYKDGTVVCFAPGQVVDVELRENEFSTEVIGLLFHPDIIFGTPLAKKISDFGFFDYSQMEALHLSEEERMKFMDCLGKIDEELNHPVDRHSGSLLSANIQVMLEYLHRFYDRQFVTRHKVNSEVVARFQQLLKNYYAGESRGRGIPSVAYFAECVNLTPGYFGDLIRKETGSSPKDLITLHLVAMAKQRLASSAEDVSIIAYDLGFEYPAHFSRMFKRLTGQSPSSYRAAMRREA